MNFTDGINDGQARDTNRRYYRTEIPNIVDDLGLSMKALRLYVHIRRVAGANPDGRCYQGVRKLGKACNMSVGSVTNAKKELLKPRRELGNKALIKHEGTFDTIVDGKKKATDCFSVTDIWNENLSYYQNLKTGRSYNEQHSPVEQEVFTDGVQIDCSNDCSPDERKKEPLKNKPNNEITLREKEQSHSQNNSSFEGSKDDVIDGSNITEIDSPAEEVLVGVPVFYDEQPTGAGGAATFPKEFHITEDMQAWAAANISSDINVEKVTRLFFVYHEARPERLTFSNWKVWMLRERPEQSGNSGRYLNRFEKLAASFREDQENDDMFAEFRGQY